VSAKQWQVPLVASGPNAGSVAIWGYRSRNSNIQWVPADYTFCAQLHLDSAQRGRSAANFRWIDRDHERSYPMFLTDMVELVKKHGVKPGGHVSGVWGVKKRGQNYGIYLLDNA
jgi:hypothetical protein